MLSEFIKNHKTTFIVSVLVLIAFVGFSSYVIFSRIGKEPVEIYLIPGDTVLTVDGKRIGEGTAYLPPGTYEIEAKREGFKEYKNSITITEPNKKAIDIALQAESETALEWARKNEGLYLNYEGRAGKRANVEGEEFSKFNPISSKLPYENFLYTLGYRADPSDPSGNTIIIEIDALPEYRQAALKQIRDFGYDPTDFKINFRNYESPFGNE